MIYDVLLLMLCTFFKGLFLNLCTFFKGLFALFCHFFKGLSVAIVAVCSSSPKWIVAVPQSGHKK